MDNSRGLVSILEEMCSSSICSSELKDSLKELIKEEKNSFNYGGLVFILPISREEFDKLFLKYANKKEMKSYLSYVGIGSFIYETTTKKNLIAF